MRVFLIQGPHRARARTRLDRYPSSACISNFQLRQDVIVFQRDTIHHTGENQLPDSSGTSSNSASRGVPSFADGTPTLFSRV